MKRFIIITIALFVISLAKAAVVADDAIYVWTSPTEYTCYLFSDTPAIEYDNDDLVITVGNKETQRIALSSVNDVEITYGIKYPTVKLNNMGYATLSFKADMQLNSDCIKAYTAMVVDGEIICTEIADGIIPAGNGVLLKGTADATVQLVGATSETETLADNDLKATTLADGSLAEIPTLGYNYTLNGSLFYEYSGTVFAADKAYFNLSYRPTGSSSTSKMSICFNDMQEDEEITTGIDNTETASKAANIYDLQGRKVSSTRHGVYVVNGRKVMIK